MSHIKKALILSFCAGLLFAFAPQRANADGANLRTILKVYQPIEVPGKVLLPGKYVMKLLDPNFGRSVVAIYNANQTHLVDAFMATPDFRMQPESKSVFLFDETPAGDPLALGSWFYPEKHFGLRFLYPHAQAATIYSTSIQGLPGAPADGK